MNNFNNIYKDKKVLITGHTGFKGSWLSLWLHKLGAAVYGGSNSWHYPHFRILTEQFPQMIKNKQDECTNYYHLEGAGRRGYISNLEEIQPDIIFHLAAQPIVSYSYENPHITYFINTFGTLNLLEAVKSWKTQLPVVCVLTDKIYKDKNQIYGYREIDELGGHDPYSNSKVCASMIVDTYQKSYLPNVARVAAGNCIGGGDFGRDRLIPDIIRSIESKQPLYIRNKNAVRPWSYVLDILGGYLTVGEQLLSCGGGDLWNFGPSDKNKVTVETIINMFKQHFDFEVEYSSGELFKETNILTLDSTKANSELDWYPMHDQLGAIFETIKWYKEYLEGNIITEKQLEEYLE